MIYIGLMVYLAELHWVEQERGTGPDANILRRKLQVKKVFFFKSSPLRDGGGGVIQVILYVILAFIFC